MNDLRSRSRALAAVPDEGSAPTSTPPRVRPETEERNGRRMSRRQSIAERARKLGVEAAGDGEEIVLADDGTATVAPAAEAQPSADGDQAATNGDDHKFRSSRPTKKRPVAAAAEDEAAQLALDVEADADSDGEGPSSRPNRRREMSDDEVPEEDKFPWHFQFDDDEPEELQASSPLLSRAFRATIG